mgnify:CR=1 FL=1
MGRNPVHENWTGFVFLANSEQNAEQDKKLREDADLINKADSVVFQTEKSIKDLDDKISETDKTEITELVTSLKESVEKRELDVLESKIDAINTKFQTVSQNLYNESNPTDEVTDKDFSDVEFDEVK